MAENQTPSARILSTMIKDVSFENIAAQNLHKIKTQPQFELNLNIKNRKIEANHFEVSIVINVTAKDGETPIYVLELEHAGRFELTGVAENQQVPFLYIECPRLLFPYTRRVVSQLTMDGGFVPLNLDHIDFVQLFQNSVKRQQEQAAEAKSGAEN